MQMQERINELNTKAWALRHTDVDESFALADEAFELANAVNFPKGIAEGLLTRSHGLFRRADYKLALEEATKALGIFESLLDNQGAQRALNTMGIIYGQSGDLMGALKTFLKAHKLCSIIKDKEAEANALNNLAIIYVYFGDYSTSLDYYLKSLNIYRELKSLQGEVKTLQNVGVVYFEMGHYKDALEYFLKSADLAENGDDRHTHALTVMNIGRAYAKLNEHGKALDYHLRSLNLMQELQDKSGVSYSLDELGNTHLKLGNSTEAETYLQHSLSIKRDIGDRKGQADTLLILGTLFTEQENYDEALVSLDEALDSAKETNAKAEIYRVHKELARANKAKGDFETAYQHLEQYIAIKDDLFNANSDQRFNALRVSNEVEQAEKEREIYRLKSVELAQVNSELTRLTNQLERQAKEDPLTKLFNRRHFDAVLEENYKRAYRYQGDMSVMICDIDNFKKVNDTFSHQIGDEVLIKVAELFKANLREVDTVARYGGEEFVVLFPETEAKTAAKICEKMRTIIETYPWHTLHQDLRITLSMGVCDDVAQGNGETMVARADDALYAVKRNGKNAVKIWEETVPNSLQTTF